MPAPTVALVQEISALANPAERNRRITGCYHALAVALRERIGTGANWCAFATWASRQAGMTIRREDADQALDDVFADRELRRLVERTAAAVLGPARRAGLARLLADVRAALDVDTALERASTAVARGNLKVFEEIALEFARFMPLASGDAPPSDAAVDAFCSGMRDGDPPSGQRHLRRAFQLYAAAATLPDGSAHAAALFHANVLVGLHEQTRLQPEIAEAMECAVGPREQVRERLRTVFVRGPFWTVVNALARALLGREPLDPLLDDLIDAAARALRRLLTATMMTLHMPGNAVLRLAEDLPDAYPDSLRVIHDPELAALLVRIDPDPSGTRDSGTADWADFPDRMHFIVELFRTRHEDPSLYQQP